VSLQLIVGPPNSGRAAELFAGFRDAAPHEPVLVVPTADDVAAFERELCAADGVALGASIATFSALAHEVTRALGASVRPRLTVPQRQALIRAAIRRERPRLLRRSASTPGFAPALDALIAELQAAMISVDEFERLVSELDQPGHERELASLYRSYVELRDSTGRGDDGLATQAAIASLRAQPEAWGDRPVFLYGFDDLTRAQLELIDALARAAEVTVAVTYEDRRALAVRAALLAGLREELGAVE
jgi:ATP-dependent helicase/DNAse subunit B